MRRVAALLRAVNVGGRKLAMADLRRLLAEEGFEAPETLLNSGNAVFGAAGSADALERRLESALAAKLKLPTEVLVRDAAQLQAVLAANPFPEMARDDPSHLVVVFTRGEAKGDLAALAPWCADGEQAGRGPGCLYVTYPAGIGRSKLLLGVIEKKLSVLGTARNWNTVGKLAERLGAVAR